MGTFTPEITFGEYAYGSMAESPGILFKTLQYTGGALTAALSLDFTTGALDPRITFSRASNAMLWDSAGNLTYAPNNLVTYSGDLTNVVWSTVGSTKTGGATNSQGAATATKITASAATARHGLIGGTSPSVGSCIASGEFKQDTHQYVQLAGSSGSLYANFDLASGVVGAAGGSNYLSHGITALGGGWFRCWVKIAQSSNTIWWLLVPSASSAVLASWTASGSEAVFMDRFQIEAVTNETSPRAYKATTSAAYYGPRFDHDPATLAPKGLLIEEARTNLLLNSLADGTNLSTQSVSLSATAYTLSFYGTGTITLSGASTAGPLVGTGANNRVSLTFTPTAGSVTFTVSGTVKWANLETGAFSTSHIPTTSAAATRAADNASMAGSNFSSWFNADEGAFVVEVTAPTKYSTGGVWSALVTPGGNNDHMYSAFADTYQLRSFNSSGIEQAGINSSAVTIGTYAKIAAAYKANDFAVCTNGGTVGTNTSGTVAAPTQLILGGVNSLANPWIKSLKYYSTRLPDATLQSLTT